MKIQVKVGNKWRNADATIDDKGRAVVKLEPIYGNRIFKVWRKIAKAKVKA